MTQEGEILPQVRQGPICLMSHIFFFYIVNIMGADDLGMQGATASATMILT